VPNHYFYLLVPIVEVFKDTYLKSRNAQLLVFLINFTQIMQQSAIPVFDMRQSLTYERQLQAMIAQLIQTLRRVEPSLELKLVELLTVNDPAIEKALNSVRDPFQQEFTLLCQQEGLLSYLIRNFCERLTVSYLKMEATLVVWDLLIFGGTNETQVIEVLALVLKLLSAEVLGCRNIAEMVDMFLRKAVDVHEYDLFLEIFNHFKHHSIDDKIAETEETKRSIPHMRDLLQKGLSSKVTKLIDQ